MADIEFKRDPVAVAGVDLEEKVDDLLAICRVFDDLAGDNPPEWLGIVFGRVVAIHEAAQGYLCAVNAWGRDAAV